jgi:hypothetical protein
LSQESVSSGAGGISEEIRPLLKERLWGQALSQQVRNRYAGVGNWIRK